MSWLLNLYETYEANADVVGEVKIKHNEQEYTLLPVSHTTQNAHIEVDVTPDGKYHLAKVLEKNQMSTLIPCTEESASRAGAKISPYPLHDKLSYVAGDFKAFGGEIKKEEPFITYIEQLRQWAESPYANDKVKAIYRYLRKGRLIQDLIDERILYADEGGRLIAKWDKTLEKKYNTKPPLYSLVAGSVDSAFVRFNVYSPGDQVLLKVWKDPDMYESFIRFYQKQLGDEDVCYVTAQSRPRTERHANKIRHAADKAKLISANDTSGFTFRGRFKNSLDVASISYDVSQKAHNALKWLIQHQGRIIDQRVFLVWSNHELDMPGTTEDLFTIAPHAAKVKSSGAFTNRELALEVGKALDGYKNKLPDAIDRKEQVNILVLDSATTGRMAVLYYRNLDMDHYFERLVSWHSTCTWLHRYRKDENGDFVYFQGAPATRDIALAAYGSRAGDKVIKGLVERMLPCIIDQRRIPLDIVQSVLNRASNPVSMDRWEWEKTLTIACALLNKHEGGYEVALDTGNDNRDYLFGRLLAAADVLERRALGKEENRATNAIRYMNAFSKHPARTWKTIQDALQPYQARLGVKALDLNKTIDEIGSRIRVEDFNNRPLSGVYLLGFYSQRHELYQKKATSNDAESNYKGSDEQ